MEAKHKSTKNSVTPDPNLSEDINVFRPKLAHIKQRSEEIFMGSVSSKRMEFDPILENIYDRWYALIKDSEKDIINIDAAESLNPSSKTVTDDRTYEEDANMITGMFVLMILLCCCSCGCNGSLYM